MQNSQFVNHVTELPHGRRKYYSVNETLQQRLTRALALAASLVIALAITALSKSFVKALVAFLASHFAR